MIEPVRDAAFSPPVIAVPCAHRFMTTGTDRDRGSGRPVALETIVSSVPAGVAQYLLVSAAVSEFAGDHLTFHRDLTTTDPRQTAA